MILSWLRGLALLRYPELVRDLGERRFHLREVAALRARYPLARLSSDIQLVGVQPDRLILADQVTIRPGTVLAFDDEQAGPGRIIIGKGSWIGEYNNLRAGSGGDIRVGERCLISQFCTLVATNHQIRRDAEIQDQGADQRRMGIVLEDDVWLGAGVVVLPGVTISRGAVIGANSVVNRNVGNYEIVAGSPARHIGQRAC